jgi:hypothetical protein
MKIGDKNIADGYMNCLKIIKESKDRTNRVSESGVCGEYEFTDGSMIIAIPHWKSSDRDNLVRSNTKYYIEKFLSENGFFIHGNKEELLKSLNKFMENSYDRIRH